MNEKNNENVITLGDLFHSVIKNIWLAVIVTVFVTILGGVYTFFIADEKYEASSTVVVAVTEDSNGEKLDYNNSARLTYTIKDLIKQDVVVGDVAREHNLDVKRLIKAITVNVNTNSYLLTIDVKSTDKDLAVLIVNELVDELIHEVDTNSVFSWAKGSIKQTSKAREAVYDSPNKPLFLIISFVLGGVISLVTIFVKEFASNKYKNRKEVEAQIDEKVIGVFFDNPNQEDKKLEKEGKKIVKLVTPSIRSFEPYNKLLSNIKYSNLENPYKVIMSSSTAMSELKSTVCANLAYCMSNNSQKVLIIDLDTRKPMLHKVFKVSKENGLVEYIEGSINKEQLIKHSDSGVDVITVGKKIINPMVVVESNKLANLINELKEEYDYILLDTPPVLACSDGLAISKLADGVMFNVALEQSRKSDIKDSIRQLKAVNANIIGLNLTKVKISKNDLQYYNYEE